MGQQLPEHQSGKVATDAVRRSGSDTTEGVAQGAAERRYASAQDFAEDLQSYTLGLPVSARRGTFSYRSGKFIKRNKLSLVVTAIFALVVLAGAVTIVREARIARMQEARAEQRFESLRKLTNSLLFEFHDSIENLPGSRPRANWWCAGPWSTSKQIAAEAHNDPATLRDLGRRLRAHRTNPESSFSSPHGWDRIISTGERTLRESAGDSPEPGGLKPRGPEPAI